MALGGAPRGDAGDQVQFDGNGITTIGNGITTIGNGITTEARLDDRKRNYDGSAIRRSTTYLHLILRLFVEVAAAGMDGMAIK